MSLTPMPVPLMTAAERAGFRAACEMIRAEGARMRRAACLIGDAPQPVDPTAATQQQQKNVMLDLCGRAVELVADRAEAELQPLLH